MQELGVELLNQWQQEPLPGQRLLAEGKKLPVYNLPIKVEAFKPFEGIDVLLIRGQNNEVLAVKDLGGMRRWSAKSVFSTQNLS